MSILTTCLLLACYVVYLGNVLAVAGTFDAANGYKCAWDIARVGRCRELKINCRKENAAPYHCVYSGDPHNCRAYNKNANSLNRAFARILGNDGVGACNRVYIEATNICPGVVYTKKGCHESRTVLEEIILKEMEYAGF